MRETSFKKHVLPRAAEEAAWRGRKGGRIPNRRFDEVRVTNVEFLDPVLC